jgi:predicted O-methyltransferase YrrM
VLPTLPDASVDALFLDAEKSAYGDYLVDGLRLLRKGGLLMVDNALAFGQLLDEQPSDPEVGAIREFNDLLHREARFQSVIVPLGDGFWAGIKE